MATLRFKTRARPFREVDLAGHEETQDEANEYDQRVSEEIRWKEEGREYPSETSAEHPVAATQHNSVVLEDALGAIDQSHGDLPSQLKQPPYGPPAPPSALYHSRVLADSTHATPRYFPSGTLPSVPTPNEFSRPLLPGPAVTPALNVLKRASSRLRSSNRTAESPDYVDSPIDTPDTDIAAERLRTEQPSPIPLGNAALSSLRGKKDYQTLTKTFDLFNKTIAKAQSTDKKGDQSTTGSGTGGGKSRGRGRGGSKAGGRANHGLGGRIFEGLRFCIPPELGLVSKHKQRWDIISKLGGQVTLQPDTAITHVIYDRPSASVLCRELGLQTLSELPIGTVCVKWEWVVSCKLAGKILDTNTWLSFPKNAFSRSISANNAIRASSRFVDITDQLKGKSISISRKRQPTASDSDTESPKRPRTVISRSITAFPSGNTTVGPSKLSKGFPSVATNHVIPSGPGWEVAPPGETDGLDEMISGVINGTVHDPEIQNGEAIPDLTSLVEDPDHPNDQDNGDDGSKANGFKCEQEQDGIPHKGPNEWLAKKFEDMHDMYQAVPGKNFFSIRQYRQAASIMRRTTHEVTSGAQALKIKGIGAGIVDRIDEFISGGPGRHYYEDNEKIRTVAMLKDIYGVGRTFANELYNKGARSIEDLRTQEYGLTPGQLIGVDLYEDLNARIPRSECRQIFDLISAEAMSIDPKIWIEIMGSYRRGQEDSGDVDILITRDTADGLNHTNVLRSLVARLKQKGVITHDLSVPHDWTALEAKWMGVGRVSPNGKYRRIDILCIPFEQWGAALIYFTGNEIFNRSLRLYAKKKGFSLNQRGLSVGVIRDKQGLKKTEGEIVASRTEQEIFDVLGLRWRHPHHRRP